MFEELQAEAARLWNENELAQGGLIIGVVSMIAYQLRQLPHKLIRLCRRLFVLSITCEEHADAFEPLASLFVSKFRNVKSGEFSSTKFGDIPSDRRWLFHCGCLFVMRMVSRDLDSQLGGAAMVYTLHVQVYGKNRRESFESLARSAKDRFKQGKKENLYVYSNYSTSFDARATLPERDFRSIYSPFNDELLKDVEHFLDAEEAYSRRGIPHRRCYLLYGVPGTGKSSTAIALANHLQKSLYTIDLSDRGLSGNNLAILMSRASGVVLIEDIDAQIESVKSRNTGNQSVITLANVLNSLDGALSQPGLITIITTNHVQELDHAVVRPGRIDRVFEFTYMQQPEFDKAIDNLLDLPAGSIKCPEKMTPAVLQQCYQMSFGDPDKFRELVHCPPKHVQGSVRLRQVASQDDASVMKPAVAVEPASVY